MTRGLGRTGVATLLVAIGVVVPCAAWYVVGSSAARQQGAMVLDRAREQVGRQAANLAEQLALRLEALRRSESARPYEEYLTDEEFLATDCAAELAERSPLTRGPVDPLIWTHFQIDDVGLLTLPTLGSQARDGLGPAGSDSAQEIQWAILSEMECASTEHLAALVREPGPAAPRVVPSGSGVVTVQPFSWHSASVKQQPALVAVREVVTPAAVLSQGFVVLSESLRPLLETSSFPATLRPGQPAGEGEAALAIYGDAWTLSVDASDIVETAGIEARRVVASFRTSFGIGALAALLAGCAAVLLVRRTEVLASERSRFAAAAAHELRTPLAGLQLYGEMLAEQRGDPSRAREYARRVADESQRLGRVVSNMLGFSRMERGGTAVSATPGDLATAVGESVERLRPSLEQAGLRLDLALRDGLPAVRFDRDALHQILQNLLDNAEKYSRSSRDRTVRIAVEQSGKAVVLSVSDHGPGIGPSERRRLFRPFSRSPGRGAPEGLGIGLALVRSMARAQQAEVSHSDVSGGGSRFSVRFPAC